MKSFRRALYVLCSFFTGLFSAKAQQPIINSLNPLSGYPGSTLLISGSGFDAIPANNIVFFGATKATVTAATPGELSVQVPSGAGFSPVTVTTANGTAYSQAAFLPTHPGGVNSFSGRSFATPVDAPTGASPQTVTFCDFDGDGKPDLASGNFAAASFSVCRNTGSNGVVAFAARVDIATAASPWSIATGDIDGDGKPDLAITSSAGVSVYINNSTAGNIAFAPKVDFAVGTSPRGVEINDVDGDGKADIAVANYLSNTISVLRNTTTGAVVSFAPKVDFTTASGPFYLSLRDIDGDGKPDACNSYQAGGTVSVFRNTSSPGSISFAARVNFTAGGTGIACADIDGDGKTDIASAGFAGANISILRNNSSVGSISFAATVNFPLGNQAQPSQIAIADLNGDGKPDIVVPDRFQSSRNPEVDVFRNTSPVGFISMAARVAYALPLSASPTYTAVVDVDGDGRPDIAAACNGLAKVAVLKNLAPPVINSFSPVSAPAGSTVTITGYNFKADVAGNTVRFGGVKATVTSAANTALTVTVPAGATYAPITVTADGLTSETRLPFTLTFAGGDSIIANSFAARTIFSMGSVTQVTTMADFDGDGKNDVVIYSGGSSSNSIFRNTSGTGNISFATPVTVQNFAWDTKDLVAGDLNGDGKPELVGAAGQDSYIQVYQNTSVPGNISFSTDYRTQPVSLPALSLYLSDLNADGLPDIIVDNGSYAVVIPNTSTPTELSFGDNQLYEMYNYQDKIAVADFDGDGKADIVMGQYYRKNTSAGGLVSFGPRTSFAPAAKFHHYVTGDFNNDGKPDIAGLNTDSASVRIYNNTSAGGNISFSLQPVKYRTGPYPVKMSVADMNGDGRPDIAVTNYEYDAISVLANSSAGGSISFANKVDYAAGHHPMETAVGDLDGDAKPDILIATWHTAAFSVLRFAIDVPPVNIPQVNSFIPSSGAPGDTITISGNNFSNNINDNTVMFGAVKATVVTASTNSLQVKVPVGALPQSFTVTNGAGLTGYSKMPFKITFPGAGPVFTSNSFDTARLFAAADGAKGICVGDIDGDGKNDVVTANENTNNISVFKNSSDSGFISFAARVDIAAANQPRACVMADLNADGKPELLVANAGSNLLLVYRNNSIPGTITYAPPISFSTDSSSFGNPVAIAVRDLDGDGKPDVAVVNSISGYVHVFRNSFPWPGGDISLGDRRSFWGDGNPGSIFIEDMDGNGKPDIVLGDSFTSLLSNTSTTGAISFTRGKPVVLDGSPYGVVGVATMDLDEDSKPDIALGTSNKGHSYFLNRSTRGTHLFEPITDVGPTMFSTGMVADDLDGDGKTDIAMTKQFSTSVVLLKNNYNPVDTPYFKPAVYYPILPSPTILAIATGDIDGDGKPDVITSWQSNNFLAVMRNKTGEPLQLCPNGGALIPSGIDNATYQWQLSTDGGLSFADITNNSNYSGTNTASLQLSNIPASFTGYQYRCVTSAGNSGVFTIRFFNTWTGAVSNAWENPANWSCGTVPDMYTDVVIGAGSNVVLNSNTTIATMIVNPTAIFTVGPGFTLTLAGH